VKSRRFRVEVALHREGEPIQFVEVAAVDADHARELALLRFNEHPEHGWSDEADVLSVEAAEPTQPAEPKPEQIAARDGDLPKLVSRAEAAAYAGVHLTTWDRWAIRYRIEKLGPAGSPPRFRRADVIRLAGNRKR